MLALELHQQALGALALQSQIAARRTTAADDRQPALLRICPRFLFAHVHQRPDHHMRAVVGHQLGRHRLQGAGEEEVQQQRLDEVVRMVTERYLGCARLFRDAIQHAAAQPRAQRARRRAVVEDVVDRLPDPRVLDAALPLARRARAGDQVVLVFLVAGVDIDRDEREPDRRALAEHVERLQQRPAVLAAREPDHDAVAVLEHVVVDNRPGGLPGDTRLELAAVCHENRL